MATFCNDNVNRKIMVDILETIVYGNNAPYKVTQIDTDSGNTQELRMSEAEWVDFYKMLTDNGWYEK